MEEDNFEAFEIFPWNDNLVSGIAIVDEQHQQLVALLNRLAAHLANRSTPASLEKTFDELLAYTEYHFSTEEALWHQHLGDDPWVRLHDQSHEGFIDRVRGMVDAHRNQPLDAALQDVIAFLCHWLAHHILDADKRMSLVVQRLEQGTGLQQAKREADAAMNGAMNTLIDTVLNMYDVLSARSMDLMREKTLRKQVEADLATSEQRWAFILESGGDNIWDWDVGSEQVDISHMHNELIPIEGDRDSAARLAVKIHPGDIERVRADIHKHLQGETDIFSSKYRVIHDNGTWHWALSRAKAISRNNEGYAQRVIGIQSDVTDRELGAMIFRSSSQAMFVTDAQNNIISTNHAFTTITGYSAEEVIGKNPRLLSSGKHGVEFYEGLWAALRDSGGWTGEIWNRKKNGDIYPQKLQIDAIRDSQGEIDYYIGLFSDITEKKKAEALIVHHANYDLLTNLPNRWMLQDRLQQELERARRNQHISALLYIDLDHFKDVNDSLGHEAGDRLLVSAAERIVASVRKVDTVARIGGDEFAIIMPELSDDTKVDRVVDHILAQLNEPFVIDANECHISASIGIVIHPNDADNLTNLLKFADQAMYRAKKSGGNRYCYFTPSMQQAAERRHRIQMDLHRAIDHGEFELYYQPIINLQNGQVSKAEVLLRWHHPDNGLVGPSEFIQLAEDSGLILQIGRLVMDQAVRQAHQWQDRLGIDVKLSINVSPAQFRAYAVVDEFLDLLATHKLSPSQFVLEITEGLLVEAKEHVLNQLLAARVAQLEVAIDDFGTGYSALAYLKKFQINYLKLDQSFVDGLPDANHDRVLCQAIILMAQKLNIDVIAEGIETRAQSHLLADMGCNYGQGYYYSEAVPAAELEALFQGYSVSSDHWLH